MDDLEDVPNLCPLKPPPAASLPDPAVADPTPPSLYPPTATTAWKRRCRRRQRRCLELERPQTSLQGPRQGGLEGPRQEQHGILRFEAGWGHDVDGIQIKPGSINIWIDRCSPSQDATLRGTTRRSSGWQLVPRPPDC